MQEFILTGLLGVLLIATCCLIIYEASRQCWARLPNLTCPPHLRVLAVVGSMFVVHIINIWLFGFIYFLLCYFDLGSLRGIAVDSNQHPDIFNCLYFSAVIYSTLGLGDIIPERALRMITAAEALTGFMLIGWTVSFTYLAMQRFWELPHTLNRKDPPKT